MAKKNMNVAEVAAVETAVPTIKTTPVEERKYTLVDPIAAHVFKGKQRQITYNVLLAAQTAMTISELAEIAEAQGLTAKGGVEPSVRYHLHHLTKDGFTEVTNPTIEIK